MRTYTQLAVHLLRSKQKYAQINKHFIFSMSNICNRARTDPPHNVIHTLYCYN